MLKRKQPASAGGNVQKKHALSLSEGSVQQGRSHFDARSVHGVREHGKMARTPLAAFFNIPLIVLLAVPSWSLTADLY